MNPLTPLGCDLTDFQFMPLDVARLRDSGLASSETPEACWAAVLLWAASWHQIPAASVPNDERWLAKAAGYMARGKIDPQWPKIREGAMRGFVLCDDGRLYHSVVAEKARESWQAKLAQRWRTECARIKKHNERHGTKIEKPAFDAWMAAGCPQGQLPLVPSDNGDGPGSVAGESLSKGEGEGQGHSSSVAKATDGAAAPAPVDNFQGESLPPSEDMARSDLWRVSVKVLQAGGCADETMCRSFMGKLVGDYTMPIVQQAVAAAISAQPAEAREYLKATCQRLLGERRDSPTVPEDPAAVAAAALRREAERVHAEQVAAMTPAQRQAIQERMKKARDAITGLAAGQPEAAAA